MTTPALTCHESTRQGRGHRQLRHLRPDGHSQAGFVIQSAQRMEGLQRADHQLRRRRGQPVERHHVVDPLHAVDLWSELGLSCGALALQQPKKRQRIALG